MSQQCTVYTPECEVKSHQPVKLVIYCRTFDKEYNLSIFKPKKENGYCKEHKTGKVTKEDLMIVLIQRKCCERRERMWQQTAKANSSFHAFCFDLEEVLSNFLQSPNAKLENCPINETWINFLPFSLGNSDVHSYFWSETDGKHGASA